jgi:hypothetical protein
MSAHKTGWPKRVPTSPRHRPKLPLDCVLAFLKAGEYTVDPATGTVFGRRGRPLRGFDFTKKKDGPVYTFVRIYGFYEGRYRVRTVPRSHVVWVSQTGCLVPDGWEVHHRDRDTQNDAWLNLICLHPLDHKKLHAADESDDGEIPF